MPDQTPLQKNNSTFSPEDYGALLSALNQTAIVSIADNKGTITYANDKFVEVAQYSREELIGQNHRILKSHHQPQELFEQLWKTISSGNVWRGEIKNRAKDGSFYWVDTSIAPILNGKGKPERYIAVRFLVTEKKKTEEGLEEKNFELTKTKKATLNILEDLETERRTLAESRAKDDAILTSIGDGLIVIDKNGGVVKVNKAFQHLLGWKDSDIVGKNLADTITLFDSNKQPLQKEDRPSQKVLHQNQGTTIPLAYYGKKDGTLLPVSLTMSPVVMGDTRMGAVEVFRDITKEQEVDRAKTEFVSLASHQLRTPLSTINWYAEMLLAGDAGEINKEQRKYIEEIYQGNQRMVDLVGALLNVSRIELGTFMVSPQETNVVKLAEETVRELEPKIFERKIDFQEHYAPNIPLMQVDPKLMGILFQNLMSNAVKYTPVGGAVNVTIDIAEEKGEKKLRLEVKDTGYGIPAASQSKIFSKLYRADNIRSKETDGTGLGLYIVKAIMDRVGGTVSFVSEENKGTTFTATLPLRGMEKKEGSKELGS